MELISQILIGLVALLHVGFLWLEMFAWTTVAPKIFRQFPKDLFPKMQALAANQGLYNGFLSAGLIWSLTISDPIWKFNIATFFLLCVMVAGLYGAFTASKKILYVQFIPALLAWVFLYIAQQP